MSYPYKILISGGSVSLLWSLQKALKSFTLNSYANSVILSLSIDFNSGQTHIWNFITFALGWAHHLFNEQWLSTQELWKFVSHPRTNTHSRTWAARSSKLTTFLLFYFATLWYHVISSSKKLPYFGKLYLFLHVSFFFLNTSYSSLHLRTYNMLT